MKWVIGIDEVGRGPLAGPVYVAAAAISVSMYKKGTWLENMPELKDSKQMTARARERCFVEAQPLRNSEVIKVAVSSRTGKMIDKKGITACIRECIAENLQKLGLDPKDCMVLLDGGLKAPSEYKKQQTIIKGDDSEKIISLASVVAKVQRDHFMIALHRKHPQYNWADNKGYGTKQHVATIKKTGITPLHRMTFLKKILLP